jgi:hypothetical protein
MAAVFIFKPAYSQTSFDQVLELSDQDTKLKVFEKVSTSDNNFKIALEESIKILYLKGDWSKFFSYAQYYRKSFKPRIDRVALLEALALLRHCQYEILESLSTQLLAMKPEWSKELAQIQALAHTRFSGKASSKKNASAFKEHAIGHTLWKTETQNVKNFHPRLLRVKVENQCGSN